MQQNFHSFSGPDGAYRIAYTDWGNPANRDVLVCAHGAIRQSRDFDTLASGLADRYRVVAVDLPGRGESEWLSDKSLYTPALYRAVFQSIFAELGGEAVDWIGSSMGGGLGLHLAATRSIPIRRLILNDSGAQRGPNAPAGGGGGENPTFKDLDEAEAYLRVKLSPYGIKDPEVWRILTRHSTRPTADRRLRLHHDPAAVGSGPVGGTNSWDLWDRLEIPVLILRGADSTTLTRDTAEKMVRRRPSTELVEFEGCGHFPSLTEPPQITVVRDWLARASATALASLSPV